MGISRHALERANERLNLSKCSFTRLAEKALLQGLKHGDCKGRMKRYADKLWLDYKIANNIRFFGEIIFFFKDDKLITVYQLPNEFKKYLKITKK